MEQYAVNFYELKTHMENKWGLIFIGGSQKDTRDKKGGMTEKQRP